MADAFLAKFKAALAALQPGDPMNEKTTLGPLSTESVLVQLLGQVDTALADGAKLVLGGKRNDRPGEYAADDPYRRGTGQFRLPR